jgi:Dual specificity phosphatase, catalytic domain
MEVEMTVLLIEEEEEEENNDNDMCTSDDDDVEEDEQRIIVAKWWQRRNVRIGAVVTLAFVCAVTVAVTVPLSLDHKRRGQWGGSEIASFEQGNSEQSASIYLSSVEDSRQLNELRHRDIKTVLTVVDSIDEVFYTYISFGEDVAVKFRPMTRSLYFVESEDDDDSSDGYVHGFNTTWLPVADEGDFDLYSLFPMTNQLIEDGLARHHSVLVHCHSGMSRSATVVAAYLMQRNCWTEEDTLGYMRERRHAVYPNAGFRAQLNRYWKKVVRHQCTQTMPTEAKRVSAK